MTGHTTDLQRAAERLIRRRAPGATPDGQLPLWDASLFGLDRVARFRDADETRRRGVLSACAGGVLAESWFIERCGIAFCARMTLAAESLDERRVYALIGADEATHSAWLEPWIADKGCEPDAFNRFIAACVEEGSPQPLAYLLQVVLEGFGIVHYADLGEGCRDAGLAATLQRMAQDEALHHAAGLAAIRPERMSAAEMRYLVDASFTFLEMIRSGPQSTVAAFDRCIGVDSRTDIEEIFAALDAPAISAGKLARLHKLMTQPGVAWLIDELTVKGAFTPCDAAQCARIYVASR